MQYDIIDSSIFIGDFSEEGDMYDSGYTQEIFLDTILSTTQVRMFKNFMQHFSFDSLQEEYESGIDKSCDSIRQIYIEINWNGKKKNIQIEDCYQENIRTLFDAINRLIPKENPRKTLYNPEMLRFDYRPEMFQCRK